MHERIECRSDEFDGHEIVIESVQVSKSGV